MLIELLQAAVVLATAGLLVHVASYDFKHLIVRNQASLALLVLYLLWAALGGFQSVVGDLIATAALTLVALVMWLLKAMGAGDVKLYFGLGLFVGYDNLAIYTVLLLLVSILLLAGIKMSKFSSRTGGPIGRLKKFEAAGRAPYAVPMSLAAIPTLLLRAFG